MIEYLTPLYLSAVSRWHGSAIPTPKLLEGAMYAAPYAVLSGYHMAHNGASMLTIVTITVACLAATTAAKNTGHADGFKDYVRDNAISKYVVFLSGLFGIKRDSQAYDALFFGVKGFLIAAFTAIIAAYFAEYKQAAALLLSGAIGYPLAYWIGFNFMPKKKQTMTGELLSGFFAGFGFYFVV